MLDYFTRLSDTLLNIDENLPARVARMINASGKVFVIGNGGSQTTADHFVCDLLKAVGVPAISLSTLPLLTAYANDEGYDYIYTQQIKRLATMGDLLVCVSTSGNSPNVVNAAEYARLSNMAVIGLTAFDGGRLAQICDINIHINTDIIEIAEDAHMAFLHNVVKYMKDDTSGH